jgi:hypothetical protein
MAPTVLVASVVGLAHLMGLGRFTPARPLVLAIPVAIVLGGAAGLPLTLGEEYGWRGSLLPRSLPWGKSEPRFSSRPFGPWHLPILLIGLNYPDQSLMTVLPLFAVAVGLMAFPFTWLYVDSGGSALVVAVMHSVLNATGDTFTAAKYLDGNPLIVSAGGVIAAAFLLGVILVYSSLRYAAVRTDAAKH